MQANKSTNPEETPQKGACCHCCDKCFPRKHSYTLGKCGICSRLGRKCPFGLDHMTEEEMNRRPSSNFNSVRFGVENTAVGPQQSFTSRPSSARRVHVVNSPAAGPYHRSIVTVPTANMVQQVYYPVYPVVEIQPVFYSVTVPIRLSDIKGQLTSSTIMDTQPN